MKIRIYSCLLAVFLFGLRAAAADAPDRPAQPVAVVDFSVPEKDKDQWSWAGRGVADLLQIELERVGVVTVDRDFIRAVIREQHLIADSTNTKDQLKLASLLNARHLISGKVTPLDAKRFRLEATAFSVEEVEAVVTAAAEGAYPVELSTVLRSVAGTLAKKLVTSGSAAAGSPSPQAAPKPESLIMFYRGLDTCARGQPEVAAAWFMNSSALDPDFAAPVLWEIRAYEMAGLAEHARIRREETSTMTNRARFSFSSNEAKASSRPVVAVLQAVVTDPRRSGSAAPAEAGHVNLTLRRAILADGKARLFAYEGIGDSLAEQDLQLSSLFASEGAPRYGRWLMSDGLLLSSINYEASGEVSILLSVLDPLTSATTASVRESGRRDNLDSLLSSSVGQLITDWTNRKKSRPAGDLISTQNAIGSEPDMREMRPAYQALAAALCQLRNSPTNGDAHAAVAGAFLGTGRLHQAGEEVNRRLDALDIHATRADLTYFGVHRWVTFNMGVAGEFIDHDRLKRRIEELLTKYPQSLAAGVMQYNLALEEWHGERWTNAVERARSARVILEPLAGWNSDFNLPQEKPTRGISNRGPLSFGQPQRGEGDRTILAGACFLEGASLVKLGQLDGAAKIFQQTRSFLQKYNMRGFCLPATPFIWEYNGVTEVAGYGGDRPEIMSRIEEQLELIAKARANPAPVDYVAKAGAIYEAETHPKGRSQNWLRCAEDMVAVLEQVKDEQQFGEIMGKVNSALSMARSDPKTTGQMIKGKLLTLLLKKRECSSLAQAEALAKPVALELARDVIGIFNNAGWASEVPATLAPFFEPPYTPEFGFSILPDMDMDTGRLRELIDHLAARLPANSTNVPAPIWIKLAQRYSAESLYREALATYGKIVTQGMSPDDYPGLSAALIAAALNDGAGSAGIPAGESAAKRHAGKDGPSRTGQGAPGSWHASQEIRRLCAEAGLPPIEPVWYEWFNHGRKYQNAHAWDKAIVCYRQTLEFLDGPEKSGRYTLEKQAGSERIALRWGKDLNGMDLGWSNLFDSRWHSATFYLAQCLIEAGRPDEAAPLLRRMAVRLGGDQIALLEEATWNSSRYHDEHLGVRAAEILKTLHAKQTDEKDPLSDNIHARK